MNFCSYKLLLVIPWCIIIMDRRAFTVRIYENDYKKLVILAVDHHKRINEIVNQAIREFIVKHRGK